MKFSIGSLVGPDKQKVTFIELFFDLVFVFAVTQTVGVLHDGITWKAVGESVLLFWLVWWGWTQFTWTLNRADTTHELVELITLIATATAFFMAVALPEAFEGRELAFALPYVAIRILGLGLQTATLWASKEGRAAVRTFGVISIGGMVAVVVGAVLGGEAQYWLWGFAILLDVIAVAVAGEEEGWNVFLEHFTERHGLFVIIVLGETLIIAGIGLSGREWTTELIGMAVLSVVITFGLWWSYFDHSKGQLDKGMERFSGTALTKRARDVYSLFHFLMIVGVIAVAVVTEEVLAHPGDPLHAESRAALGIGILLFVAGMSIAVWRASSTILISRSVVIGVAALIVALIGDVHPIVTMSIAAGGVVLSQLVEQVFELPRRLTEKAVIDE